MKLRDGNCLKMSEELSYKCLLKKYKTSGRYKLIRIFIDTEWYVAREFCKSLYSLQNFYYKLQDFSRNRKE